MGTLYLKMAGGNWSAAGTWSNVSPTGTDNSGPPTAADDVLMGMLSGACTIDAAAACRSLDCAGASGTYPGTLTHNSAITLSIGDGTAGTGNRALRFNSTMTYTKGSVTSSAISFVSTSATQQTITTAGKTVGNVTFNATSNGSWLLSDSLTTAAITTTVTLTKGSLDTNGQTLSVGSFNSNNSNTRSLTLGASSITITGSAGWNIAVATNLTISTGTSTIAMTAGSNSFYGGAKTYNIVTFSGGGSSTFGDANTFGTLTLSGQPNKTDAYNLNASQTITGTLTISSHSATNRILVASLTLGTTRTFTAATLSCSNVVDFRDITGAGAATWTTGASGATYFGDCGGNSGITFTTAATQTWSGTSGGDWSTNAWTSRVPLPQDDVVISSAFSASQTITLDMPRAGKSINWTGATGTPAWAKATATTVYGSVTMIAGMTNSGTANFTMEGRGSFTWASAGQTFTNTIIMQMVGGTLTLQDAFNSSKGIIHDSTTTFTANNFNFTAVSAVRNSAASFSTLNLGSGTWTLTQSSSIPWEVSANQTINAGTSTIRISDTGASSKTFAGGGKTYNILDATTGGSGAVIVTGANSISRITATGGGTKTFTLPGSTTTTLTGTTPFPSGAAGNLLTFAPSSGSATVSFTNQASCDYVSLTNIIASGTTPAYAGTHSTDGGGNTNWLFSAPGAGAAASPNLVHSQAVTRAASF